MNPCAFSALKVLPSELGSTIGPQHVDGKRVMGCETAAPGGRLPSSWARAHEAGVGARHMPAVTLPAAEPGLAPKRRSASAAPLKGGSANHPPLVRPYQPSPSPLADELAALGAPGLAQLVAEAAAGGKPRLFFIDYMVMDSFWDQVPQDRPGRCEHAGRALLFLQQ